MFDVWDIAPEIEQARRRACFIGSQVYRLSRHFWLRPFRKYLMALSDDINAVSDTLDALAAQAPPAITAAIAAAAAGSVGGDPNAAAAATRLQASASAAVAAIQGVVPAS